MVNLSNLFYIGNWVGDGRYMAAQTEDGKIIKDLKENLFHIQHFKLEIKKNFFIVF